jgi:heat shock protein HslJ
MRNIAVAAIAVVALACSGAQHTDQPSGSPSAASSTPVTTSGASPSASASIDGNWTLVQLADSTNVSGSGGRAITMRLQRDSSRVTGYAGCNGFGGEFSTSGDSLKFGALMSTKMACPGWPMDLETRYLAALADVVTYNATDSTLVLNRTNGTTIRFRR